MYNSNRVRSVNHSRDAMCLRFIGYRRCRADNCFTLTEREACERHLVRRLTERRASCPWVHRLTGKHASYTLCRLTGKRALWLPWLSALLASSPLMAPKPQFNSLFKYKTFITNILVRTLVCKPTASPGSQEKTCQAGFLQLLITNILDRTPVCKVRAMVFCRKPRKICCAGFVHLFNANGFFAWPVCNHVQTIW